MQGDQTIEIQGVDQTKNEDISFGNKWVKKRDDYLSWDEIFMQLCHLIAQRSKDPNSQNGACIVDENNIIVGLGYNGWPRGIHDDDLPWGREGEILDTKYAYVVHAEENAVYNSNKSTKGCILYSSAFPCNECAKTMIQMGIKELVYEFDRYPEEVIYRAARILFNKAGIRCRQYRRKYYLTLSKII